MLEKETPHGWRGWRGGGGSLSVRTGSCVAGQWAAGPASESSHHTRGMHEKGGHQKPASFGCIGCSRWCGLGLEAAWGAGLSWDCAWISFGLCSGNGALNAAVAGLLVATVARTCYMAVTGGYGLVFAVQQKQCPRGVGRAGWWINAEVAWAPALALEIWFATSATILRRSCHHVACFHSASGGRLPSVGSAFARHCRHCL